MSAAHDTAPRQPVPAPQHRAGSWQPSLLAIALVVILTATLTPIPGRPRHPVSLDPVPGLDSAVENIILFWPLGAALALRRWGAARTTVAGCALSVLVETVQYWLPGRFCNLDDALMNGLGALTGNLLVVAAFSAGGQRLLPWAAELLRRVRP